MKKILALILVALMLFPLSLVAGAESTGTSYLSAFENRPVMDDLVGGQFGGEEFSILRYPYIPDSEYMQIMTLLEFGYSEFSSSDARYGDYSLFLYVYNPGNLNVSERDVRHSISMKIGDSETAHYTKYPMQLLSTDGDGEHDRLYMKFKIKVGADELRQLLNGATERIYNLSEMEIVTSGNTNATAYEGGRWVFTGTSGGYNKLGESTLMVKSAKNQSVVTIRDIGQATYRTLSDNSGKNHVQIDSVYFTIPHEITDRYGEEIVDILYEYWAYDTGYMVGFEHDKPYDIFKDYQCIKLEEFTNKLPVISSFANAFDFAHKSPFLYNGTCDIEEYPDAILCDYLTYVFKYAEGGEAGQIVDTDVKNYFSSEWEKKNNGLASVFDSLVGLDGNPVTQKSIVHSKDLHYSINTTQQTWWEELEQRLWDSSTGRSSGRIESVPVIQKVTDDNINDVKNLLYITSDSSGLANMYREAKNVGDNVYVFHFAWGDYYSSQVWCNSDIFHPGIWVTGDDEGGFACRENIYMDFDMIEMTFEKDNVQTTLPVQMSPENVIGELQLPYDYDTPKGIPNWVRILIAIALVIIVLLVVSIFFPVLVPVLKALVWVLVLPIRLLWWLLKAVGKGIGALFRKIGQAISNRKRK